MRVQLIPPGSTAFKERFEQFRYSVFRLETLQNYGNSGEDPALEAFRAGRPHLVTPGKRNWTAMIRANAHASRTLQRVHVVTEPISDYLRFELTWGYWPNVEAGEDIRIIPIGEGERWPMDLPHRDYWLFDSRELYDMHYDPDGTWLGTEPVTDPARIVEANAVRDAALFHAAPWSEYVGEHPELSRHVKDLVRAS